MKLVIADDESLVRVSLTMMIKEMEAAWQIVGEATNGEELLERVAEHKPDIAIVDIRMPKMDGLEAIRQGRALSPLTRWILLSGFSDFEYAHQALKLGVSEYLLKPVAPAELEKTLLHIYRDNKEYIGLLNQQFENNVFALCNGLTSLKNEERSGVFFRGRFTGWIFVMDAPQLPGRVTALEREFYDELRRLADGHIVYGMNAALLSLPSGALAAVAAWDPETGRAGEDHVSRFFGKVKEAADKRCGEETMMTVLKTEECAGFEAMNEQLQQLMQWTEARALCGIGRILSYSEVAQGARDPDKLEASRLLSSIAACFQNRMYLQAEQAIGSLETLAAKSGLADKPCMRQAARLFLRYAIGLDLPGEAPASQTARELRTFRERALREAREPVPANLADQVIQYVEQHYMDDIGIGQMASELNVSVAYLSTLFHKKTGITFVKYLTRIRMHKAKELLLYTNLQIKQVAERVGYYSTRHFTKLFTEMFGKYPSEIRKIGQQGSPQRNA
ncbi:response regulator transcription factor [Cohnella thermotolerans]|uniref:response regulator transcription factor n=1 Tax=Cohnella thermotolerans TaxID=329858 RepID=UPI0003F706FD|nr:response regulator [Cohnella thermotolerans]